jgi:hypothetical protein
MNPNHDPKNGQFTSGSGGGSSKVYKSQSRYTLSAMDQPMVGSASQIAEQIGAARSPLEKDIASFNKMVGGMKGKFGGPGPTKRNTQRSQSVASMLRGKIR